MNSATFSGSYAPEDVTFLLKPVQLAPTETRDKERLIQSGERHYSEMISIEHVPSPRYVELFSQAMNNSRDRFARHLITLGQAIAQRISGPITLVSLARAGTPVGVLLHRLLSGHLGRESCHYSLSIIRDRGIDTVALDYILERHAPESVVFVDGWTGKGVIGRELTKAVSQYPLPRGGCLSPDLYVVADLSGTAAVAATCDDYLIPSSILNAVISGLVSRSILNRDIIGPNDFHGCVYYEELAPYDLSRWFVDEIAADMAAALAGTTYFAPPLTRERAEELRRINRRHIENLMRRFDIQNENYVKPGIGEATRVLLRRVPDRVIVRDAASRDVAHILRLVQEKNITLEEDRYLPYEAAAIIRQLD